jgi:hypothetical protein
LYAKDGSLWVELIEAATGKNRPLAARLSKTAVAQRVADASPVLVDGDDQLWVRPVRVTAATPEWGVFTPGNLEAFAEFPPTFPRRLVAAGANRVVATSELGVLELTSTPAAASKFSAGAVGKFADPQPVVIDSTASGTVYLVTPRAEGNWTISTLGAGKK